MLWLRGESLHGELHHVGCVVSRPLRLWLHGKFVHGEVAPCELHHEFVPHTMIAHCVIVHCESSLHRGCTVSHCTMSPHRVSRIVSYPHAMVVL